MNNASAVQKTALKKQSSGIGHTLEPSRHVCFYKSGDAQFCGLPVIINNRTFKTFEALLDSLSKRIPLPFGVRTITTPRGHTTVRALDELQHGHSYICSDKRIVKPIDLEQAWRRPPPWYHARPASGKHLRERPPNLHSTRRTSLLHTPKRLVVFRNGNPEVKHTFFLHKSSTHSFEALLVHISETMCFPVRRLHTPDGGRVDGLPALILCSGVLVAAGREPFRKGNYNVRKPFAPTWLPAKTVGKLNPVTRKKKSVTSSTKSWPFSPSSERYIVNQLYNSFAESAYDETGSAEIGHLLDSIAETDTVTCTDGDKNEYVCMPKDDDIEKSFCVNQDGSMTVEMKVRLTIKEEETVHWATTLSRKSVTSQMKAGLETHSDLVPDLADKIAPDIDTDALAIQSRPEEYCTIIKEPLKLIAKEKQISVKTESQESKQDVDTLSKNANSEQEHCFPSAPDKCNRHPVPKPHSVDITQLQAGMYKSAEVLQIHDNGQETMLRIYQQEICQKGFLANTEFITQEIPTYDAVFSASNAVSSSSNKLESMQSPNTVYSSFQQPKNVLPFFKDQASCENTMSSENTPSVHNSPTECFTILSSSKMSTADISKRKKKVRVILRKNYIIHIMTWENKGNKIQIKRKKIRTAMFNQAGGIKGVTEEYRTKSIKTLLRSERTFLPKTVQMQVHGVNELYVKEPHTTDKRSAKKGEPGKYHGKHPTLRNTIVHHLSTNKCTPTQPKEEQDRQRQDTQELLKCISFPALPYSSSVLNEYVELQPQKSEKEHPSDQEQMPPYKPSEELVVSYNKSPSHIPLDKLSVQEPFSISPKRGSAAKGSSLSQYNTLNGEMESPSVNMHLPINLSMRNNHWKNITLKGDLSPNKNCVCQNSVNGISHENVQLTNFAVLDTSIATLEKISLTQEIIELSQSVTKDKDFSAKLKSHPIKPSAERTLSTQHSIEQIPKNNTWSKATLFKNQDSKAFHKMTTSGPSSLIDESFISRELVGLCENDKHEYLRTLSEKQILPAVKLYTVKMAVRPDMKHVLDELCYSIYLLREATLHKQLSCLEKSKNILDFFLHLAFTFGSSSRVFLAFISVMVLRNGLENINARQVKNSHSFSEALLMLQSLKEMAAIEDAEQLRVNLDALLKSTSGQLLQNWKGFQHLCEMRISSHVMSKCTLDGSYNVSCSEEEAVQGLMEELGVPDRVREELAAFHTQTKENVRCNQVNASGKLCKLFPEKMVNMVNRYTESSLDEDKIKFSDCVLEDIDTYVKYVIEKAVAAHINSDFSVPHSLLGTEKDINVISSEKERNFSAKDSNLCNKILKEKQQRIKEKGRIPESNKKTYAKQERNMKEMKYSAVCEMTSKDDNAEEHYITETHSIYFDKEMELMKDMTDTSKRDKNSLKLSESGESEKERYELKEDNDEHTNIFEDMVNNKEKSHQINSKAEIQAKWQNKELVTESCTQLNHKSKSVKTTRQPKIQNTVLPDVQKIQDQTKKIYSKKQQAVVETPEKVNQENIEASVVCDGKRVQDKRKNGSVAKLVSNLETHSSGPKSVKKVQIFVGHTEVSDPDILHNNSLSGKLTNTSLEDKSSSLSFSYDSQSSSVAQESDRNIQANRVKNIRDMFLAKSQTRTKTGKRQLHCPKSDVSDSQPECIDSGNNRSQETSNGEDDTSRLAISKGFVRRTIERIYGRSNSNGVGAENILSLSALKIKEMEGPERPSVSRLTSYHEACTRETDLSYFSATNTSDIFTVPSDCVTLNKQVQYEDPNSIDKEYWQQTDESASKLKDGQSNETNQTISVKPEKPSGQEDSIHKTPTSTKLKKCPGSPGSKFTYFNLPYASDSELEPEKMEVKVTPETQPHKNMAERNSLLFVFNPPVLKKSNNKVHPLKDSATVVRQPINGQGALTGVIKQSEEPDALEMLFLFCGQHCPIL